MQLAMRTVDVFPMGRRGRYGLTPELQKLYRLIVHLRREKGTITYTRIEQYGPARAHIGSMLRELQDRGWIDLDCDRRGHIMPDGIHLTKPIQYLKSE